MATGAVVAAIEPSRAATDDMVSSFEIFIVLFPCLHFLV
jgi:hypothetical protein